MQVTQPEVAGIVVRFVPRTAGRVHLSALDRAEIEAWRDYVSRVGFDRMIIHEREPGDHAEVGNFVALHRRGEAWAHYNFARKAQAVIAWCGVSGADIGAYATIGEAFRHVLPDADEHHRPLCPPVPVLRNVVTHLLPRLQRAAGG